jgi:hypothetical protein
MFLDNESVYQMKRFDPGSFLPQSDAMSTAPRRQGFFRSFNFKKVGGGVLTVRSKCIRGTSWALEISVGEGAVHLCMYKNNFNLFAKTAHVLPKCETKYPCM